MQLQPLESGKNSSLKAETSKYKFTTEIVQCSDLQDMLLGLCTTEALHLWALLADGMHFLEKY